VDWSTFSSPAALVYTLSQVLTEEDQQISRKPITEKNQSTRAKQNMSFEGKLLEHHREQLTSSHSMS